MSNNKENHDSSFKKSRLVYFGYFLIAFSLLMSAGLALMVISILDEKISYVPQLLPLVIIPLLIYFDYQIYMMHTRGDMYVSNGIIYYRGYGKGWLPQKRYVEIPIPEIQSVSIRDEEVTRKFMIDWLCIEMADSTVSINVSPFERTSLLKTLARHMLECKPNPTSVAEDNTLNLYVPAHSFYPRRLRVFINGTEHNFDKDSTVYSFQVSTGDVVSIKYLSKFRISRIIEAGETNLVLSDLISYSHD